MSCPYLSETTDRNRPRTMILFATAISRLLGRVRTSCEMFRKAGNICNATMLLVEGSLLTAGLYTAQHAAQKSASWLRTMISFATAISRLLGRVRTSCEMFWKAENICNATVLLVEGSLLTAGLYRFIGSHEAKIAAILQKCMSCPYLSETTDRNRPRGCKLHASPARLNAPKWRRGCMPVRRG